MRLTAKLAPCLLSLFVGCGQEDIAIDQSRLVVGPPRSDEARLMACAFLAIQDCPTTWYYPAGFGCDEWSFLYDGDCFEGLQGANGVLITLPSVPISSNAETALGEEMVHWKFGDHDHARQELWGDGTGLTGKVGEVNAAIVAAGM